MKQNTLFGFIIILFHWWQLFNPDARHVFTGEKVAVKVIDKMKLDQSTRTQMMQEVRLMKLVQHPNVVRLYEVNI